MYVLLFLPILAHFSFILSVKLVFYRSTDYNINEFCPQAELDGGGYLHHIRAATAAERAGGYTETLGCCRALQEAMAGLYFVPGTS